MHPLGAADRQSSWHWDAGKESSVHGIPLHNAEEAACGRNTQGFRWVFKDLERTIMCQVCTRSPCLPRQVILDIQVSWKFARKASLEMFHLIKPLLGFFIEEVNWRTIKVSKRYSMVFY